MNYDGRKNITFQQLETIFYLMEDQSFSGAARRMYLSQPALTKQVKNLEQVLGQQILIRHGRGISLTDEGKILYAYAKKILKLRDEAREKVAQLGNDSPGEIHIGASTIPATYILPRILGEFRKIHPRITSHVKSGDSAEVIDNVVSGQGDIGIVGKDPASSRLYAEPLWRDRLVIIVPAGHPWQGRTDLTPEEFLQEPFIIRERGSATREIFEQVIKERDVLSLNRLNVSCEIGSSEAVKEAVIAGLGISIISLHAVVRELASGILARAAMENFEIVRSIFLIYRKHLGLLPHQKLFIDHLRSCRLPDLWPGDELIGERTL